MSIQPNAIHDKVVQIPTMTCKTIGFLIYMFQAEALSQHVILKSKREKEVERGWLSLTRRNQPEHRVFQRIREVLSLFMSLYAQSTNKGTDSSNGSKEKART